MKLLMLVNPHAGRKKGHMVAQQSLAFFQQQGLTVKTRYSEAPGQLIDIARAEVNGDWDGIVAVGGDGTLFEILNGLMAGNPDLPIPLGVIPVGTGNSFSRDLAIGSLDDALRNIVAGQTRQVDVGQCTCAAQIFYFINILGFGFVADVVHTSTAYKKWGALSYIAGVLIRTIGLKTVRLEFEIDGQPFERDNVFVEICNSTKTGGDMLMAPAAKIDDGLLDVVLLNKISRAGLLAAFPKIFKGTHIHIPQVETFTGKQMLFRPATPKVLTPDGEIIGQTPITVSVLPGKIRVFDLCRNN